MNIEELSAVELGRKIASRELSSVEATEFYLGKIDQHNESVRAFISLVGSALDEAKAADEAVERGEILSPLHGVPIAIKDVLCTQAAKTTCGSRMLESFQPPYESTATKRLQAAGLVAVGKTNMDEFAMGGSTESSFFGATANPWDLQRTPGGSSGGAAAALSAGMVPLSVGSDTGGSVRQPASFCGVCGLKPTYGRISRYGLVAFASSLDQVGPLAHHVKDLAALLQIMAGPDSADSTCLDADVPDYVTGLERDISGMKVGFVREYLESDSLDAEILSAVNRTREMLEQMGCSIVDIEMPHTEYAVPAYYIIAPCEASGNLSRYDGVHYGFRADQSSGGAGLDGMISNSRSEGFGDEVKRRIMLGTFALSAGYYDAYYKKALQVRRLVASDYQKAFNAVDLILGPVAPTTAYKLGEKVNDPVQMYLGDLYTVGANLAGIPAISIPAGRDTSGLPIGIQLQAPALAEAQLLNAASRLQQAELFQPQTAAL
ncbi:MAG: Asp-tRNA(Asn)/Glu-tRNA(Gln) amidotransferase subunit GatA [Planctomycetota bacterium]